MVPRSQENEDQIKKGKDFSRTWRKFTHLSNQAKEISPKKLIIVKTGKLKSS